MLERTQAEQLFRRIIPQGVFEEMTDAPPSEYERRDEEEDDEEDEEEEEQDDGSDAVEVALLSLLCRIDGGGEQYGQKEL